MMKPLTALALRAVCAIAATTAVTAATDGSARHEFGPYVVAVTADTSAILSENEYQITVESNGIFLTRLTAPIHGVLSDSFVADLDHDGKFDVVVTYTSANGQNSHIALYTWRDPVLQPVKLSDLDASQAAGYRGGDIYAVRKGQLIRMFQIYTRTGDHWEATAAQRTLRYDFGAGRWISE